MISRQQLLQGITATTILGLCRPLWATKQASHFLNPGEKLKPGEYVWEPELSPEGPVAILVSLPISQRLTWGGVFLHAGGLPGYPSSHGCVHLLLEFSAKLFEITHLGTAVIIADNASAPADVVHPGIILSGDADQMIAQERARERRKKHKTVPPAAGDHPSRVPVASVVVSGADRKSYIFKDGEIVDQKAITIANPDQPLGTHVLVLKTLEGKHPTWSAVSIRHADSTAAVGATDSAILDRIKFDPTFVQQALEAMHPGMSLMITDLAAGPETRSDRDLATRPLGAVGAPQLAFDSNYTG